METNPYESPGYGTGDASSELVSERIIQLMLQTKPWVRFLSVLGFIITGIMALGFVVGLIDVLTTGMGGMEALTLLMYLPLAAVYFFASLYLGRYASRIQEFAMTPKAELLEEALAAQRSFWRLAGMMMVVFIAAYVLFAVGLGIWFGTQAS